jgi:hypothetical protein
VNILTGDSDHMAKYLAEHQEVDSIWYFGSKVFFKLFFEGSTTIVGLLFSGRF